jgi:hypothetical protein
MPYSCRTTLLKAVELSPSSNSWRSINSKSINNTASNTKYTHPTDFEDAIEVKGHKKTIISTCNKDLGK